MKKIFKIIGLISLTCFSFFITEKTTLVVKNMDSIMISINENKEDMILDSIDAKINDDTIIPGIKGRVVNVDKSYMKMKEYGKYNEELYIYDYIKPSVSLDNNKDKKIIGINSKKRMVSLIFIVRNSDNIYEILDIINNYNIKGNFFIDSNWLSTNSNTAINILKEGHNIGFIEDTYSIEWMTKVIKNIDKDVAGYCIVSDNNKNICIDNKLYLLEPFIVSNNKPLLDVKNNVDKKNILAFNMTKTLKKELPSIIIYITAKGYDIENLDTSILE